MGKKKIPPRHHPLFSPFFPVYLQPSMSPLHRICEWEHHSEIGRKGTGKNTVWVHLLWVDSETMGQDCHSLVINLLFNLSKLSTLPQFPHLRIVKFCISNSMMSTKHLMRSHLSFDLQNFTEVCTVCCLTPSPRTMDFFFRSNTPLSAPQYYSCQPETQHTSCSLFLCFKILHLKTFRKGFYCSQQTLLKGTENFFHCH